MRVDFRKIPIHLRIGDVATATAPITEPGIYYAVKAWPDQDYMLASIRSLLEAIVTTQDAAPAGYKYGFVVDAHEYWTETLHEYSMPRNLYTEAERDAIYSVGVNPIRYNAISGGNVGWFLWGQQFIDFDMTIQVIFDNQLRDLSPRFLRFVRNFTHTEEPAAASPRPTAMQVIERELVYMFQHGDSQVIHTLVDRIRKQGREQGLGHFASGACHGD